MNLKNIFLYVIMLATGLFLGKVFFQTGGQSDHSQASEVHDTNVIWTCSMDPQIRQGEPGKCPICGMDLIPLQSEHSDDNPAEIKMSKAAIQLANIVTMVVGDVSADKLIRIPGKIQQDERRVYTQPSHLEGRIESLTINYTGETVSPGQQIASIYSPELVTAQQELFTAIEFKESQPALYTAAKNKIKNWKLNDDQIEQILQSGKILDQVPVYADVGGVVINKMVNLGDYVMRGMPLYKVVDLNRVWVFFDVYESDMSWVKTGNEVEFSVQSLPGEKFKGQISFIDPIMDPMTRVAKARVEISNPGFKLKPEMFVTGIIRSSISAKQKKQIIIPKSAVLWTGERSVVYVQREDDSGIFFGIREVELGPLTSEGYVIRKGLENGELIAVSGAFSIDAAAQLAGKQSMMNPNGTKAKSVNNHHARTNDGFPAGKISAGKEEKLAVKKLIDKYFELKDALVLNDLPKASSIARLIENMIKGTDMGLFKGEGHSFWMKYSASAQKLFSQIPNSKTIDEARTTFKELSEVMILFAQNFGPFEHAIYIQHCPMADNNTGADWLSLDEQIRNPYFGDKMLKCGKTTSTIR